MHVDHVSESATVSDVLRRQAGSRGDHPLLICDSERVSYAEAERLSALLSRGLIGLGAGKGTHVGLLYPNGVAFVVGMLAAARIGAVVIPFSTFATARELREQLVDSDTEILLAASSFRSHDYVQRLTEVLPGLRFRLRRSVVQRRSTAIAPCDLRRLTDPATAPRPSTKRC